MIIDGRGQNQHFRLVQQGVNLLHIVLLNALAAAFGMAVFAGQAAGDFLLADGDHVYLVARLAGALGKSLRHGGGGAVGPGTAVEN